MASLNGTTSHSWSCVYRRAAIFEQYDFTSAVNPEVQRMPLAQCFVDRSPLHGSTRAGSLWHAPGCAFCTSSKFPVTPEQPADSRQRSSRVALHACLFRSQHHAAGHFDSLTVHPTIL